MVTIKVKNIKAVENALKQYGEDAENEIKSITQITAQEVEGKAKSYAPVDNGQLRQSIVAEQQESKLNWRVTAYMPYSAFQEFGTGGLVDIKEGWGKMAAKFKGKGIKQINLTPQPFMYPAFIYGRKIFKKNIKDSLKALNKKFNNG